jgi:hypothetical protein
LAVSLVSAVTVASPVQSLLSRLGSLIRRRSEKAPGTTTPGVFLLLHPHIIPAPARLRVGMDVGMDAYQNKNISDSST